MLNLPDSIIILFVAVLLLLHQLLLLPPQMLVGRVNGHHAFGGLLLAHRELIGLLLLEPLHLGQIAHQPVVLRLVLQQLKLLGLGDAFFELKLHCVLVHRLVSRERVGNVHRGRGTSCYRPRK